MNKALKRYDAAKLDFDINLDNENCKHSKTLMEQTKKTFEESWDKIYHLFSTDKDFKVKLKNKEFDSMSDSKIEKLTKLLNDMSTVLEQYVKAVCK